MKVVEIVGVTALLLLLYLYERPKLKENGKKVQKSFFAFIVFDWFLAVTLILFPKIPGPGDLIDFIYKSIGSFWET
ncbi:hypothetical protein BIV60_08260 [Bacillus sp. MUM 116]|uniref:hypothetical protein n=1 Tax=Bacillus sp. MUM 116 TaxID=1678002 RepID=UPI0008F5D110|nr:hypothetical protein [Bacillus sp. MUM 116]OIK15734.1 hypothetical protein BIV60_08260 [Bacillus sp. MUM 116]